MIRPQERADTPSPRAPAGPPEIPASDARKLTAAVRWARVSGASLLALGALSAVVSVRHPLSAGFLVSVAVVANGAVEWAWARRLRDRDGRAPRVLALNQIALSLEIVAYAGWQMATVTPEAIHELLRGQLVQAFLGLLPPEETAFLLELLHPAIRLTYGVLGLVALAGCWGAAGYYLSRRRLLAPRPGP